MHDCVDHDPRDSICVEVLVKRFKAGPRIKVDIGLLHVSPSISFLHVLEQHHTCPPEKILGSNALIFLCVCVWHF
jgi:hypothetical protein